MPAHVGSEVKLTYDTDSLIGVGCYLRTPTGRTYLIIGCRYTQGGPNQNRKRIRAIVVDPKKANEDGEYHPFYWNKRGGR